MTDEKKQESVWSDLLKKTGQFEGAAESKLKTLEKFDFKKLLENKKLLAIVGAAIVLIVLAVVFGPAPNPDTQNNEAPISDVLNIND